MPNIHIIIKVVPFNTVDSEYGFDITGAGRRVRARGQPDVETPAEGLRIYTRANQTRCSGRKLAGRFRRGI